MNSFFIKGGLISLWLQSPKRVPNHCPEYYPPKEKLLKTVIWRTFLKIGVKVKNFLGLSHLYKSINFGTLSSQSFVTAVSKLENQAK